MATEESGADLRRWREAYRSTLAREAEGCPGQEALAALVLGELAGEQRERVADHVAACTRCADDYRLLIKLHSEASAGGVRTHRRWTLAAAAAVAVALAGSAALRLGVEEPRDDTLRGAGGAVRVVPIDGSSLSAAPREVGWEAEAGAVGYRVRLFDATGTLVWQSDPAPSVSRDMPAEVRSRLTPGGSYFWVVDVEGPAGPSRLGPFWFHLAKGG
jgi:hypothetical protein